MYTCLRTSLRISLRIPASGIDLSALRQLCGSHPHIDQPDCASPVCCQPIAAAFRVPARGCCALQCCPIKINSRCPLDIPPRGAVDARPDSNRRPQDVGSRLNLARAILGRLLASIPSCSSTTELPASGNTERRLGALSRTHQPGCDPEPARRLSVFSDAASCEVIGWVHGVRRDQPRPQPSPA